jgi:hypothetical protein
VTFTVTITNALTVTTTTLPAMYTGTLYSQQLFASGGTGLSYSWLTSGPNNLTTFNLTLTAGGLLSGTPASTGTVTFTAQVKDSGNNTAIQAYSIPVYAPVTLPAPNPASLGPATTNVLYSGTVLAAGGSGSGYVWTVTGLPSDSLSYSSSGATLTIGGTPTLTQTVTFQASVKDGLGNTSATVTYTISVKPPTPLLLQTSGALLGATTNVLYGSGIVASGGSGQGYVFSINGVPVPTTGLAGAVLIADGISVYSTGGSTLSITGTPTLTQTVSIVTVTVKDSANDTAGPDTYTIAVTPPTPLLLQTSGALLGATTNQLYGSGIVASGGSGQGYVFYINNVAVPTTGALVSIGDNISVSSNGGSTLSISGTPTLAQTLSIATVTVKDSAGDTAGPDTYTIAVNPPTPLSLQTSGSLAAATTNVAYNGGITASGGSGQNYVFTVNGTQIPTTGLAGAVPIGDGISVSGNGSNTLSITGTPTLTQEVTLTSVTVKDSANDSAGPDTYTIAVNPPSPLTLQSGGALPSATTNIGYSQSISASGGSGSGYVFSINGVAVPNTGALVLISDSISVDTNGNGTLNIAGTPTSAGSVSLTNVTVKDSANDSAGPETYTIAVITPGSPVSGQINLLNYCGGNNANIPVITVGIYLTSDLTTPVQTTTTDNSSGNGTGNGNYSFASVPAGTYTLIPSISGPSSVFYPLSSPSFTLSGTPLNGENFSVSLGYTVSGTVSYTGTNWPTYVELNNNNCGSSSAANGTTVFAPGAFSIRGVAPGSYNLNAWVDELGFGQANATDPTGNLSNLSVTSANLTGEAVTLTAPAPGTNLIGAPGLGPISGFVNGAVVNFNPISNSNNIETPVYYTLEWSTTSTFPAPTSSNSHDFAATGANAGNTWILNSANITGLTSGATYYFRAQGVAGSLTSAWSTTVGPVTLISPTGANTVTGQVTFTGTAKGPLYVGFYNETNSLVYATQVGSQASPPTSPASYSVEVPSGTYGFFGIIDQNNNGLISPDDITNTSGNGGPPSVTISPTSLTQNLTLPSAASTVQVTTQLAQYPIGNGQTGTNYYIDLTVNPGIKQPIDVTLTSGPNLINPVDMGVCGSSCGHQDFQYSANIGSAVPSVGDTYTFTVIYSDGTTDSTVSGAVSGVLTSSALATLISPTGNGISDTPSFDWTYPVNPGNYTYQFSICCGSNGFVWEIPGNNSSSNNFTYTQITPPLVWGIDPTNAGNVPSPSTLSAGTNYSWNIQSQDSNGNSATAQLNFLTAPGPVSLPPASTNPLPSGIVGGTYSASLNASGGAGGGNYYFKVNGTTIPTNNDYVTASNSDGLTFANSGGNTLFVGGTPTTANASLSLTIEVFDTTNSGDTATVVYTIAINSPTPLTLTATGSIGNAIVSLPFGSEVQANGGTGGGYVFAVTVGSTTTSVPTNGTPVALGNGLTASSNGDSYLQISGTPTAATNVPFSVSVTDSGTDTDGPIAYTVDVSSGPNGVNNKYLSGTYVCKTNGYKDSDGSRWASLSSFTANGAAGTTTGGVFDINGSDYTTELSGTSTGTFSIGADNNGIATTTSTVTSGGTGTQISHYAIALNDANHVTTTATEFRLVEIDDAGASPSGQTSTGVCYQATPAAFASSTVSGKGVAFGFQGENSSGTPKQSVGRLTLSAESATGGPGGVPGGTVTSGIIDGMRLDQTGDKGGTIASGTYTVPNSNGVYDVTVLATGQTSGSSFVVYVIDANRMFILETAGDTGVQSGDVRTQQQTSYSNSSFNGSAVLYGQAYEGTSGAISGYDSFIYQFSGNGAGAGTVNQSYDDSNGKYDVGKENGPGPAITFDSANPGRATFSPGTDSGFLYFYDTNSAFYLDLNGGGSPNFLESGWFLPQTQTTFTNAALAGTYLTANMNEKSGDASVGEAVLSSTGSITADQSTGGENSFDWDESQTGVTYSWLSSTYGAFSIVETGQSSGLTCMVITSTSAVCMEGTNGSAKMSTFQQ